MSRTIIGIDPGLNGAIAIFSPQLTILDMPTHKLTKNEVDVVELARLIDAAVGKSTGGACAFVERVHAMPKQGVSSSFAFGKGYGVLLGILAANFIPVELVTPTSWKKAMGCPAEKDGARARASQLMPRHAGLWPLKKHDGRAEAALIALYGLRKHGIQEPAHQPAACI